MIEEIKFAFHTVDISIWQAAGITFTIPIIWYLWYCAVECQVSFFHGRGRIEVKWRSDRVLHKGQMSRGTEQLQSNYSKMQNNLIHLFIARNFY